MFAKNIDGKHGNFFKPCIFVLMNANTGLFLIGFRIFMMTWQRFYNHQSRRKVHILAALLFVAFVAGSSCRVDYVSLSEKSKLRSVTDDLGKTVNIPEKVSRAISLAPSITEMVFAIGAGDRLVGVTSYCNYPQEGTAIEKIGDTISPNIEKIIALQPDLVLVSTSSQLEAFTKTLEEQHIAVFVSDPKSVDEVFDSIVTMGELFGLEEQASGLAATLESRAKFYWHAHKRETEPLKRPRVFVQFSDEPLFTIGKDSFITQVIEYAWGESVTANVQTAFPKLSKETALVLNPDVIILSDSEDNQAPNDVFKNSPAVKNGRVYKINADIISRPGPRLVDAIEQVAGFLHGEKN